MTQTTSAPEFRVGRVLGVPLALVTLPQAVEVIEGFLSQGGPHLVVTANAIACVLAHEDAGFRAEMDRASLITSDGAGTQWALKRAGLGHWPKVTGVDLLAELCQKSAEKGYRLYFLGGAPGVAEEAAERLRLRYPGCNIVGARHGFFPESDDDVVASEVAAARPDILFVAMGMPRQERFYLRTASITGARVGMGVGGSFDVFSGRVKRAPTLWQKLKLEWLWRALLNPSKIRNLKNLPRFVTLVLKEK